MVRNLLVFLLVPLGMHGMPSLNQQLQDQPIQLLPLPPLSPRPRPLPDLDEQLLQAVKEDDRSHMIQLIQRGAHVDLQWGENKLSLLHATIEYNAVDCLDELLENYLDTFYYKGYSEPERYHDEPDLMEKSTSEFRALHYAAELDRIECLKKLPKDSFICNEKIGEQKFTPLHVAQSPEAISLLIESGADPHAEDADGNRPMGLAIQKRKAHCVRALRSTSRKDSGFFSFQFQEEEVQAAFDLAVENIDQECVAALLEDTTLSISHNQIEEQEIIVKHLTEAISNLDTQDLLVGFSGSKREDPSQIAARKSLIEFLKNKLKAVKKQLSYDSALLQAAETNDTTLIQSLLKAGANCEVYGERSRSPLSVAALHGNIRCMKLLLDWGIDVLHKQVSCGWVTLEHAFKNGKFDIIQLLAEYGVHIDLPRLALLPGTLDITINLAHERKFLEALLRASILRFKPQQKDVLRALKRVWAVIYSLGIKNSLVPFVLRELLLMEKEFCTDIATILHYHLCEPRWESQKGIFKILRTELMRSSFCHAALLHKNKEKFKEYMSDLLNNTNDYLTEQLLKKVKPLFVENSNLYKPIILKNFEIEFGPDLKKYILEKKKEGNTFVLTNTTRVIEGCLK